MLSLGVALGALVIASAVNGQPSPEVQKRIAAAIAATNSTNSTIDYTEFVNPFIGTGTRRFQHYNHALMSHIDTFFYGDVWYVAVGARHVSLD